MSNKKQSSVEWFQEKTWNLSMQLEKQQISIGEYGVAYYDLLQEAKAMHKEEIEKSWNDGAYNNSILGATEYYNETFGGDNE